MFGVLFSIYLTFLEPFVIGAVCMWCVSSAVIMMLMLWLTAAKPEAIRQWRRLLEPADDGPAAAEQVAERGASRGEQRTLRQKVAFVMGYLVAQVVGVLVAWFVVHYGRTELYPPPAMSTVAEANLRALLDNSILVAGMIVGPLVWHVLRYRRR
jgi:hypothetical protein